MPELILDGHKLAWHRERVEAWQRGERIAPITIDCALTRRCTYRCVYCYGQLQANDEKKMTREVIFRFLDDAAEIGVKAISFVSDGESTCSPHFYDALLRGRANGLDMAVGTNGYLLRDERLGETLPALTYLRFNISAAQRDRYAAIHGCAPKCYDKVLDTVREAVRIKRRRGLPVTLGLQMVLLPQFEDQVLPLAHLGKELGVDYLVIKHCSDDEQGSLGVDYSAYSSLVETLRQAEAVSEGDYLVRAKWSKIMSLGQRSYSRCYGPPFIMQFSGSGLVAPCGMLFNRKYSRYHIGNIAETSFKGLWQSERYWEVMDLIASEKFDARTMCGSLCLQHKVNECLYSLRQEGACLPPTQGEPPLHCNFI
ncbi:MAG: radical SAM protein [Desulfarculus sp.]|jgi:MoaA/NifB/PqqE/SkfB family radical SAM enzyme|nr:MAG: radical SAM protein [Desulfarculus sp.]